MPENNLGGYTREALAELCGPKFVAELDAARWQPIATVPKDKTVDLWLSSSDGVERWRETDCWWNKDRKLWCNLRGMWDCATHWMPKPEAPR